MSYVYRNAGSEYYLDPDTERHAPVYTTVAWAPI